MEKKEMSFIEKVETAGKKLEKEIKDGGAMILIATNGCDDTYFNIIGTNISLASLLASAALSADGFEEIIRKSIKGIELYREKQNK